MRNRRAIVLIAVFALFAALATACGGSDRTVESSPRTAAPTASANIIVESVAPGDTIASPVTVAGRNRTFESNVVVRVLGADRRVLATVPTTGTGGPGEWGSFRVSVPFDRGTDTRGFVTAFDTSAQDGSVVGLVEIPVNFR